MGDYVTRDVQLKLQRLSEYSDEVNVTAVATWQQQQQQQQEAAAMHASVLHYR
jgi:hypothetical protein